MNMYEAIFVRKSTRAFTDELLEERTLAQFRHFLGQLEPYKNIKTEFKIISCLEGEGQGKKLRPRGGVKAVNEVNEYKAGLLYDFIDNSALYKNNVERKYRSIMNVPFVTGDAELDAKFIAEAKKSGLVSLKGHRLVGGMRASIYNAMPVEGVKSLIEFMKKFEKENA